MVARPDRTPRLWHRPHSRHAGSPSIRRNAAEDRGMRFGRRVSAFGLATLAAGTLVLTPLRAMGAAGAASCTPTADTTHSVARIWDETLLDAIRRDLPRPV